MPARLLKILPILPKAKKTALFYMVVYILIAGWSYLHFHVPLQCHQEQKCEI